MHVTHESIAVVDGLTCQTVDAFDRFTDGHDGGQDWHTVSAR